MNKNEKVINLMPVNLRNKYGDCLVRQWETGEDPISRTIWQEDLATGKIRNRGVMPGCFWTDWR